MPTPALPGGEPVALPGDGNDACTPVVLTRDQLLEVPARVLPPSYVDPIQESEAGGWEYWCGAAMMWARVSEAVGRFECASFITSAHGPYAAEVAIFFQRPTGDAGAITVKAGTIVKASKNGAKFKTTIDVAFVGTAQTTTHILARAIGYGHDWNVLAQHVTARGDLIEAEIDTIDLPLLDPPFGDPSIFVTQLGDARNGQEGALDMHGAERDIERLPGEVDDAYRHRIREVPDVVTPAAIRRQVTRFMKGLGYTDADWTLRETWRRDFCDACDMPDTIGTVTVCDDLDETPFQNYPLDDRTDAGAFVLQVPSLPCIADFSMVCDDDAVTVADLENRLGHRAQPACDRPNDDARTTFPGCCDGPDSQRAQIYASLFTLLDQAKAFGVYVRIFVKGT